MNTNRVNEIVAAIPACSKEFYHKSDLLPELLALQSEMVALTFNDDHAENAQFRLWDVQSHLQKMNEERGHIADARVNKFREDCKVIGGQIAGEISGEKGEKKALKSLETLHCKKHILKNVSFKLDDHRTEIDIIVLTEKVVFIVEVKNTAKDIVIDEHGNYCRKTEIGLVSDKSIGERMNEKDYLLRQTLKSAGYEEPNIVSLVVFTNNTVYVENHYPYIKTCFLAALPNIIQHYLGEIRYAEEDFDRMVAVIEEAKCSDSYPLPLDADQFKRDFAELLVLLETAPDAETEMEEINEERDNHSEVDSRRDRRYKAVSVVAALLVPALTAGIIGLRRK